MIRKATYPLLLSPVHQGSWEPKAGWRSGKCAHQVLTLLNLLNGSGVRNESPVALGIYKWCPCCNTTDFIRLKIYRGLRKGWKTYRVLDFKGIRSRTLNNIMLQEIGGTSMPGTTEDKSVKWLEQKANKGSIQLYVCIRPLTTNSCIVVLYLISFV